MNRQPSSSHNHTWPLPSKNATGCCCFSILAMSIISIPFFPLALTIHGRFQPTIRR
ncbi:Uncharacterised protein [Mycobacteroides abscessus subsp. abscessus]|nr:Uncharacterised protein [Mycobacteroides abscessus subsp. abscessus]